MTAEEREAKLDEMAKRLWAVRQELEQLRPEQALEADRRATYDILTDLSWATENCTTMGLHQVGQAMDDTMGVSSTKDAAASPRSSALGWTVAILLFPYGPFVYLASMGALKWVTAAFLVAASAVAHIGLVSVLAKTNDQPWQTWVVLLLGAAHYCLGTIQYMAGERDHVWSPTGRRLWRWAGWVLGVLLLLGVLSQIILFHALGASGHP